MARLTERLSARKVATATTGFHPDGDGLYLVVQKSGSKSWILRYRHGGKRRDMGLGPERLLTLAEARVKAREAKRILLDGIDPLQHRNIRKSAESRLWSEAMRDFIASQRSGWKNQAQEDQWLQSLQDYGPDAKLPIRQLNTNVVLNCLRPIWEEKTETATRVRGRIERVWDAERVAGNVSGDNPARWKGHLEHLLAKPRKVKKPVHFRAMPYADLPAFYQTLGTSGTALALRFTILTAARTSEVIGMQAHEVDGDVWTVPKERMKMGKEHNVPLTKEALNCITKGARMPFPLSNAAMLALLQRPPPKGRGMPYTVHGFRSSFRDWAAETTDTPNEVVEMALAHTINNKAEAAYRRGDLFEKRRKLMEAWTAYLTQSGKNR